MDNLFRLYRYLKNNDRDNYTPALRALEPLIDMLSNAEKFGEYVRNQGGFEWEEADSLHEQLVQQYRGALCTIEEDSVQALFEFAKSHLDTKETGELIELLQEQKALAEEAHGSYTNMMLGDLQDHPF